eukprot:TRINITY_DN8791_c0_g1_i11.p7 TRINITY_DN8791_c0_g1~~TRINITY_DN8791_c0_g1_i11.p7  ORF type:complete len:144 (+),score=13.55 TRINITY_DN8791_c0_g1_i11:555-986(+)
MLYSCMLEIYSLLKQQTTEDVENLDRVECVKRKIIYKTTSQKTTDCKRILKAKKYGSRVVSMQQMANKNQQNILFRAYDFQRSHLNLKQTHRIIARLLNFKEKSLQHQMYNTENRKQYGVFKPQIWQPHGKKKKPSGDATKKK